MANVTVRERVKFLEQTAVLMSDLQKNAVTTNTDLQAIAKRINVSAMYKLYNKFDSSAEDIISSIIKKDREILNVLEVLAKDEYNEGDYKVIVKSAMSNVEGAIPAAYMTAQMSTNADAQEDVSSANVNALNDLISTYGKKAKSILMELSSVAGHLKTDDQIKMASAIGKSVEDITNKMVILNNNCNEAIQEFAKAYNITLSNIEDIAAAIQRTETDFSTDGDIKMSAN